MESPWHVNCLYEHPQSILPIPAHVCLKVKDGEIRDARSFCRFSGWTVCSQVSSLILRSGSKTRLERGCYFHQGMMPHLDSLIEVWLPCFICCRPLDGIIPFFLLLLLKTFFLSKALIKLSWNKFKDQALKLMSIRPASVSLLLCLPPPQLVRLMHSEEH